MADRLAVAVADNIVSPLGFTTADNYAAVKAGQTGLRRYDGQWQLPEPFMAALISRADVKAACEQEGITGHFTIFEQMAILSISKALRACHIPVTSDRTLLILSTTKGNVELLSDITHQTSNITHLLLGDTAKTVASWFGITTQPVVVSNACISGVCAQIAASRMIAAGHYDQVIVCGVDVLSPFIVSGFQSLKALTDTPCRPFDEDRTGINLGDAAATIIYQGVAANALRPGQWYMARHAIRNDAFHISSPSSTGEGCYRALRHVLHDISTDDIAFVNAHGTATLFNDEMESQAIWRAGLSSVPVNSLKGYYGHTMGAAGVVETIISMQALNDGLILATKGYEALGVSRNIAVTTQHTATDKQAFVKMMSGFGGCNAAILMHNA